MSYSVAFRANIVKKMMGRDGVSANALSEQTGVSQATLSRWKREASTVVAMSPKEKPQPAPRRAQDWTPAEKIRAVADTDGVGEHALGAFLREHGLHAELLDQWRSEILGALSGGGTKGKRSVEEKKIRRLEREVRRKDKALAETTALLVLKKKFDALFSDGEDDTNQESDE